MHEFIYGKCFRKVLIRKKIISSKIYLCTVYMKRSRICECDIKGNAENDLT